MLKCLNNLYFPNNKYIQKIIFKFYCNICIKKKKNNKNCYTYIIYVKHYV